MAFFTVKSLILLVLCAAILYAHCYADLIDDVCSKTQNPSLCAKVLRSARNRDPDLTVLGKIAISQAQDDAHKLQAFLQSLGNAATDKELKRRYLVCWSSIDEAIEKLSRSNYYFLAKDYSRMHNMITGQPLGVLSLEALCDVYFERPPSEPLILKQAHQQARDLASIIAAVANALLGRH